MQNLPVILGLLGVWNSTFLGYPSRALLPYSQALSRFAAHIQQVDMESNGKRVTVSGKCVCTLLVCTVLHCVLNPGAVLWPQATALRGWGDQLRRTWHQRPAQLLPAHPPRPRGALRFHWLLQEPNPSGAGWRGPISRSVQRGCPA